MSEYQVKADVCLQPPQNLQPWLEAFAVVACVDKTDQGYENSQDQHDLFNYIFDKLGQ